MRSLTHTRPDEIQKWIDRGWLKSRSLTAAGTKAKIIDADDFCQRHPVPIMLLARLAVDHGWHGQGVGKALLKDAMLRTLQAADIAGIRAFAVHAKDDDARRFYLKFDFISSPSDPMHLFVLLKDVRGIVSGQ